MTAVDTAALAPGRRAGSGSGPPAGLLALTSIVSIQLSIAASTYLFDLVGVAGTAWLRLVFAAMFVLVLVRPRLHEMPGRVLRAGALLGVVTAGMFLFFLAAVDRLPLGTAVALEFLGPLAVAVARSGRRRNLLWPALAAVGIVALTEPWHGGTDPVGIGFALVAGVGWAAYILLTQHVGDALSGIQGLAISLPVAAVVAAGFGAPQVIPALSWELVAAGAGLAVLGTVLPFALEMSALRRLTAAAFGTLMSLEPAVALGVGLLVLSQQPEPWQLAGVLLVVAAGIGAVRTGRRDPAPERPKHA